MTHSARPLVLHVNACPIAGVPRAIESYIANTPSFDHAVLTPQGSVEAPGAFVVDLPEGFIARVRAVRRAVKQLQPSVVHAHSSWAGVYARMLRLPVPVVYTPHGFKFEDYECPPILRRGYWWAERMLARRTAAFGVLSEHETGLLHSFDSGVRAVRIPNVASIHPSAQGSATGYKHSNRVLMIGRLASPKNPAVFAAVADAVRAVRSDVSFVWIGDGDATMRQLLEAHGVEVTGWIEGEAITRELSKPGVYFHCSRYEGFPVTVLDAAAFEHPLTAWAIPALEETGVPCGNSVVECADLLLECLGAAGEVGSEGESEASTLTQAVTASRNIAATMTESAQGEALARLWAVGERR